MRSEGDLALTTSTSDGLIKAVNSVRWREGDEILIPHNEFPSVVYPFRWPRCRGRVGSLRGRARPARHRGEHPRRPDPQDPRGGLLLGLLQHGLQVGPAPAPEGAQGPGRGIRLRGRHAGRGRLATQPCPGPRGLFPFQAVKWIAGPNGIGRPLRPARALARASETRAFSWYSVPAATTSPSSPIRGWSRSPRRGGGTAARRPGSPWWASRPISTSWSLRAPRGWRRGRRTSWPCGRQLDAAGISTLVPLSSPSAPPSPCWNCPKPQSCTSG